MKQEENTIITLLDENGREVDFDLVCTFDYEDKRYAAMFPIGDYEGIEPDEVVLLEVDDDGDQGSFRTIDNDILADEVFHEFLEIFEDIVERDDEE